MTQNFLLTAVKTLTDSKSYRRAYASRNKAGMEARYIQVNG